eukprot:scaffold5172_cov155-Amphora_coffeaeformis.AAC.7
MCTQTLIHVPSTEGPMEFRGRCRCVKETKQDFGSFRISRRFVFTGVPFLYYCTNHTNNNLCVWCHTDLVWYCMVLYGTVPTWEKEDCWRAPSDLIRLFPLQTRFLVTFKNLVALVVDKRRTREEHYFINRLYSSIVPPVPYPVQYHSKMKFTMNACAAIVTSLVVFFLTSDAVEAKKVPGKPATRDTVER